MMTDLWQISLTVTDQADVFSEMIDAAVDAETLSTHRDHDDEPWQVMLITTHAPDKAAVARAIGEAERITGLAASGLSVVGLPPTDWLAENRKSFPPLDIASFWIYGNYVTDPVPDGKIGLKIDAGEAFGSGTHATTHGCVAMLERHCPAIEGLTIADIGCGSGILAMAAAKLHPQAVIIAVDNDPIAVEVAAQNCADNDVGFIKTGLSDGYKAELVQSHAPYDVILANILPNPLIEMSEDAVAALAADGVIILSGLMTMHRDKVVTAHESLGLRLIDHMVVNDWVTLVMGRA
ncbi:MAG: 50S ribosomal protein L11 methyltransferase [Alphaproteobacteria bacterium]|nr:50S ribosomal protein L11 methyltransferase [Alphaproteobacteria bacterium]